MTISIGHAGESISQRYRCVNCGVVVEVAYSWWPEGRTGGTCPASNGDHDWVADNESGEEG